MRLLPDFFADLTGFDWDEGNSAKTWERHSVTRSEAEQVFFNRPVIVAGAVSKSVTERRYFVLGHSDDGRHLFVVFTIRGTALRVISARQMSRKERMTYAQIKEA